MARFSWIAVWHRYRYNCPGFSIGKIFLDCGMAQIQVQLSRIQSWQDFLGFRYGTGTGTMVKDSVKEIFSLITVWYRYNCPGFSPGNIFSKYGMYKVQWSRIQSRKYFLGAQYGTMVEDSVKQIFSWCAVWYNGRGFSQGNIFSERSMVQWSRIQSRKYFFGVQ